MQLHVACSFCTVPFQEGAWILQKPQSKHLKEVKGKSGFEWLHCMLTRWGFLERSWNCMSDACNQATLIDARIFCCLQIFFSFPWFTIETIETSPSSMHPSINTVWNITSCHFHLFSPHPWNTVFLIFLHSALASFIFRLRRLPVLIRVAMPSYVMQFHGANGKAQDSQGTRTRTYKMNRSMPHPVDNRHQGCCHAKCHRFWLQADHQSQESSRKWTSWCRSLNAHQYSTGIYSPIHNCSYERPSVTTAVQTFEEPYLEACDKAHCFPCCEACMILKEPPSIPARILQV